MKLTVQIKLQPTPEQVDALRETLETANAAADRLSQLAWEAKEFRRFPLHKRFYRQIRNEFPLTAQVVCLLNAKVADAYKLDKKVERVFRNHGSISYDARILSLNLIPSTVSIWTVKGRAKMPFICGEKQRTLLAYPRGESDLILRNRKWFLNITVEVPEEKEIEAILQQTHSSRELALKVYINNNGDVVNSIMEIIATSDDDEMDVASLKFADSSTKSVEEEKLFTQEEENLISKLIEINGCGRTLAISTLKENNWNLSMSVEKMIYLLQSLLVYKENDDDDNDEEDELELSRLMKSMSTSLIVEDTD